MNQKYKTQIFSCLFKYSLTWCRHQMETFSLLLACCAEGGEFIGHQWIPHTKASDAELWCFLLSVVPEQTVEQTIEMLVIWNVIALIMVSL